MYIGVYLCFSGFAYLLGLFWLARRRPRLWAYSALAWVLVIAGLAVFEVVSAWLGLVPFRGAGSFSYPGDYLSYGPVGWLIMLFLPLGMISPLLVAAWVRQRAKGASQFGGNMR